MGIGRIGRACAALLAALSLGAAADIAAAQTGSTWERINTDKVLRIGVAQAEPWFFKDPASSEWSGIGISYGNALAEALGVKLEMVEVTWGTAIASLQSNKIDIMPLLNMTPVRAISVDYANAPLAYSALALLVRDDLTASGWQDVNKPELTIAVPHGSSEDNFVSSYLGQANILRFPSYAEQIAAFQNGSADAVLLYHPTLVILREKVGRGKIVIPAPFHVDSSDVALRREEDKTFRDWLSVANNYFYNTGRTQEWYVEYLKSRGITATDIPAIQREAWTGGRHD
jgi:polar amino acid transport system substrate-binding protein